jgi:hypothetical protein
VSTQHFDTCRAAARTTYLSCAIGAVMLAVALSGNATAALIVSSIDYDGSVRSGATTGVEEHSTSTDFPPPSANILLPATNAPLSAPLSAAKDLTMTATSTMEQFPVPGGPLYDALVVQISAPTGDVFANALDNTLAYPVQLDISVYSDTPGMKAVLDPANIGLENFDLPPFASPDPGSYTVSGLGTQANPLRIQMGLTAAQVDDQNGFVKLHLRYGEMDYVPEPATCLLLLVGLACLRRASARHRRG